MYSFRLHYTHIDTQCTHSNYIRTHIDRQCTHSNYTVCIPTTLHTHRQAMYSYGLHYTHTDRQCAHSNYTVPTHRQDMYSFQLHCTHTQTGNVLIPTTIHTHRQAMYSFQLHHTHIDRHCTHTDYITHGHCTHSLHHHCYHPLLLLSSSPCSKLMFSTNPFLHSSSTFPSTGPTPQTPAVFHFSQACQF